MTVRRYRAPQGDGELLIEPSISSVINSLLNDIQHSPAYRTPGQNFARQEVLALAVEYSTKLAQWAGVPASQISAKFHSAELNPDLIIATGHQPEWFHPGVLAKKHCSVCSCSKAPSIGKNAIAINLIVDSDELDDVSVPVPSGTREAPQIIPLSFFTLTKRTPWEEVRTKNHLKLDQFSQNIFETLKPWQFVPAISALKMPSADHPSKHANLEDNKHVSLSQNDARLCDLIASVRMQWERSEQIENLEIPLSQVTSTRSFQCFLLDWMRNAVRHCETYNQIVQAFRDEYGIHGQQRPVPNLLVVPAIDHSSFPESLTGERVEVPFWVWNEPEEAASVERERLFVRHVDQQFELSTSRKIIGYLPASPDDAEAAIEQLSVWAKEGLRIRSRALTTTLFARLYLCDLFIHGIGGAIYDQITDRLIETIYGQHIPQFLVVTATLHLPLGEGFLATMADVRRHQALLRDLQQNPWRHLPSCEELSSRADLNHQMLCRQLAQLRQERDLLLMEQKICDQKADRNLPRRTRRQRNRQRYLRLNEIRSELLTIVSPQIQMVREDIETLRQEVAANKILKSREYPWCLFPVEHLHRLVSQIQVAADLAIQ